MGGQVRGIRVREVEIILLADPFEQWRFISGLQGVPAHVRKFRGVRQIHYAARENPQASKFWRFVARSKERLQPQADAEKRSARMNFVQ